MRLLRFFTLLAAVAVGLPACGAVVSITALDVRGTGVFGHNPNVTGVTINGAAPSGTTVADPLNIEMTYSNLNLDNDGTANDSVTFTLVAAGGGTNQRAWGQGIDTGFGNLNDVTVTLTMAPQTTTDLGAPIEFDGFTGAAIGVGGNGDLNRTAEINGLPVAVMSANTGGFQFVIDAVDFAPTASVLFDNSGGDFGAISARHYDLQFSAVPEPATALLLIVAMGLAAVRSARS